MSIYGWFGWRILNANGVGHAFKEPRGRSLCGKVAFGPERLRHKRYRPCRTCSAIWSAKYPQKAAAS